MKQQVSIAELVADAEREGLEVVDDRRAHLSEPEADGREPAPRAEAARLVEVLGIRELSTRLEAAPAPTWLVEGLWPADAYGVLGAEDKAGKTWAALDLAVSVVTGTPWLGRFACPTPGPVLVYLGEGGERAMLRRLVAIAAARGLEVDGLGGLRLGMAVPRLTDRRHLEEMRTELAGEPPTLTLIDPLYLAAGGTKGSDLYAMGDVLGSIQGLEAGSALAVVTHWNKTGEGSGAKRFTGVGPGAWGRVLGSAAVERRAVDPDGASNVLLRWEFTGSEIADAAFRTRRRVWADDPNDLGSPLHYAVEVTDEAADFRGDDLSPAQRRTLATLPASEGSPATVREIGDALAEDGQGPPLTKRTIQKTLHELSELGLADGEAGDVRTAGRWWRT